MRGADSKQEAMFSYVSPEQPVPAKHPLRPIRAKSSEAPRQTDKRFEKLYSPTGRPSIASERRIRALLLQVLYSVRIERSLEADIARELFETVLQRAQMAGLLSDEHCSGDGTMVEAWASHNRFRLKDGSGGPEGGGGCYDARDFRAGQRTSDGLIVAAQVTQACGTAERSAVTDMLGELSGPRRCGLAADKSYDTREFIRQTRELNVTPHVAQNIERRGGTVINARTTRRAGYALSIKACKLIEESFGRAKDIGLLRRPKMRGRRELEFATLLSFTSYKLVRMRNLLAPWFT
ncbi:MAG: transposase [Steroidobacteraceae bacterium]